MRPIKTPKRLQYIRDLFAPEDKLLRKIRTELEQDDLPIQIGSEEGKFLQFLITLSESKKIVEIGTLAGYSTIWLARALPPEGHVYTFEKQEKNSKIALSNFKQSDVFNKITLTSGIAQETLPTINQHGPFDMIFIDADKIHYLEYLDWAEDNIKKGGLIVGDNTFLFETVYEDVIPENADIRPTTHKTMQEFNKRLADQTRYTSIMLPTKEGLTVARKLF